MKLPAVYIMTNSLNGTLYTGVTSDLVKRVWQHKQGIGSQFTTKYQTKMLVYYEQCEDMVSAIEREKQLKAGSRQKKLDLIEKMNPDWRDLYPDII
jgi:putative endonuclease